MKPRNICYTTLILLVALTLTFQPAQSAFAEQQDEGMEIHATVVSIDEATGSFVVEAEDGTIYTVFAADGLGEIQIGDLLEIQGSLNEDGSISAFEINIEDRGEESEPEPGDDGGPAEGYYCSQTETPHPFGARLAERYNTEYATLQTWFCEGFGWGQIMLALETGQLTGNEAESFLAARSEGQGWGQIWKELGLIGRPEDAGPPEDKGPNKDKNKDKNKDLPKDKKPHPEKGNPNNRP